MKYNHQVTTFLK